MDPVTASVIVAGIAAAASVASSIINARSSVERLEREETIRRLRARVSELEGRPDDT